MLYLLLELGRRILVIVPRRICFTVARFIGRFAYQILPKERAKILRHLEEAFGTEKKQSELQEIGKHVFVHLAESAVDVFRFPTLNRKRLDEWVLAEDCREKMDQVLRQGKGAIGLASHMGNWELIGAFFTLSGYPGKVVGRRIYYEPFNQVLVKLRRSALVETIYRDESAREVLAVLKGNGILGILADQDIESLEGIFVPFFGKLAKTPTAPAKISMASGAPIVPMFMLHEGGRYRLHLEEPIWPERKGATKEEMVRLLTERWSQVVEKYVRRYPDQWVWMHNRWKTRPDETPSAQEREAL